MAQGCTMLQAGLTLFAALTANRQPSRRFLFNIICLISGTYRDSSLTLRMTRGREGNPVTLTSYSSPQAIPQPFYTTRRPEAAPTCAVRRAPFSKAAAKRLPQPSGQRPVKLQNPFKKAAGNPFLPSFFYSQEPRNLIFHMYLPICLVI